MPDPTPTSLPVVEGQLSLKGKSPKSKPNSHYPAPSCLYKAVPFNRDRTHRIPPSYLPSTESSLSLFKVYLTGEKYLLHKREDPRLNLPHDPWEKPRLVALPPHGIWNSSTVWG